MWGPCLPPCSRTCCPALSCIALPPPCRRAAGGSGIWRLLESGRPAAEAAALRPPPSWRDALLGPDAWAWLAQLATVRG